MPRVVSFIVLLAVVILIGSMFFQVMVQFIVPLFLASVLVVIFKPLHVWVTNHFEEKPRISAAVTTFLIVLIVLLPLGVIMVCTIAEVAEQYYAFNEDHVAGAPALPIQRSAALADADVQRGEDDPSPVTSDDNPVEEEETLEEEDTSTTSDPAEQDEALKDDQEQVSGDENAIADESTVEGDDQVDSSGSPEEDDEEQTPGVTVDKTALLSAAEMIMSKINPWLAEVGLDLKPQVVSSYLRDQMTRLAGPVALGGVQALVSTLFSLAIMVLTLYYFFADGPNMVVALMKLSPLEDAYEQELLDKFAAVSRSVVVAVLLSALAQGVLAGIGYFFAGVNNVFLCTVLTTILAMVPFVGATVVWVPICLVLYFYFGYTTSAIVLAVYCTVVVSMVDNLIKPLVLHGQANLHPLLALLSVIGGIQVLGPIGILVGPMLVAFLQALLNMLNKELELLGKESDATGKPVVFATGSPNPDESPPTPPSSDKPSPAPPKKSQHSNKHRRKRKRK